MSRVEEITGLLGSPDPEQRRRAIAGLSNWPGSQAVNWLIEGLGDADWRVRKEAVGVASLRSGDPELLRALIQVLEPGENVGLRNAAIEVLSCFGEAAAEALEAALPGLDADGRKLAAETLAKTDSARALRALALLLVDPDANVRAAAAEATAEVGHHEVTVAVPLLEACLRSAEPALRASALDGLNRLGVVLTFEVLEPLFSERSLVRGALIAAGRCRDARAAGPVIRALNEQRGSAWLAALQALSQLASSNFHAEQSVQDALDALSAAARKKLLHLAAMPGDELELRRAAVLVCGLLGGRDAASAAIAALEDDELNAEAQAALLTIAPDALECFIGNFGSFNHKLQVASLELLAKLLRATRAGEQSPGARLALQALESQELSLVRAGLLALAEFPVSAALEPGLRWLRVGLPPSLLGAARLAIGHIAEKFPEQARRLAREWADQPEYLYAVTVLLGSAQGPILGSPEADLEYLVQALKHESCVVRRAAVEALGQSRLEKSVELIAFALADEDREVQLAAVASLGQLRAVGGEPLGVELLLQLAAQTEDEMLLAALLQALADTADERAIGALVPLASHAPTLARISAIESLGKLNAKRLLTDERLFSSLSSGFEHADSEVVKATISVFGAQRSDAALEKIVACLGSTAWDVRSLAADVLGQIGEPALSVSLQKHLLTENEPLVREAVERALEAIERANARSLSTIPPQLSTKARWPS